MSKMRRNPGQEADSAHLEVPEMEPESAEFINEPVKTIGKVAVNEQTERCPFCKSHLVVVSAQPFLNRYCQNCKKQFRADPPRLGKSA